jgi:hypothetical protein
MVSRTLIVAAAFMISVSGEKCGKFSMTDDIDIYRTANVLVELHGVDAPIQAAMKADALLEAGDIDGQAVWKRILAALDELLLGDGPEGVGRH